MFSNPEGPSTPYLRSWVCFKGIYHLQIPQIRKDKVLGPSGKGKPTETRGPFGRSPKKVVVPRAAPRRSCRRCRSARSSGERRVGLPLASSDIGAMEQALFYCFVFLLVCFIRFVFPCSCFSCVYVFVVFVVFLFLSFWFSFICIFYPCCFLFLLFCTCCLSSQGI